MHPPSVMPRNQERHESHALLRLFSSWKGPPGCIQLSGGGGGGGDSLRKDLVRRKRNKRALRPERLPPSTNRRHHGLGQHNLAADQKE